VPGIQTLDPVAEGVLRTARAIAKARGEPRIAPPVLLVALTQAAEPPVRDALAQFGLGPGEASSWLEEAVEPISAPTSFDEATPFAERTAAILTMAGAEASDAGAEAIRSRDLLFGILRERHAPTGIAVAALLAHGATHDALVDALGRTSAP